MSTVIWLSIIVYFLYWAWGRYSKPEIKVVIDDCLDSDGWDEPKEMVPSHPRPISASLRLDYRDAQGQTSERVVDVKECDICDPAGYLIGFCQVRKGIRTFRMDRIVRAIDMETGEIIPDLPAFAARKYAESPNASIDKMLNDQTDALRALFYIGKADGRFTAKEKQVMLAYCQMMASDSRITAQHIEKICLHLSLPSKQAFKLICGRLAKLDEAQRMEILNATEKMIATEKTVSGEEEEALAYMKARLCVPNIKVMAA